MSQALYLENDEDITSAVDKLKGAEGNEVSIVVPKRSTLLQSMINLKLLKKAADNSKKTLVLVTTDRLSSHLAGRVGLAVADKLGADAKIPETELTEPDQTEVIDGGVAETGSPEPKADNKEPVEGSAEESSDGPDEMLTPAEAAGTAVSTAKPVMKTKALDEDEPKSKPEKVKGTHVPDFNALQKKILWGVLALAVIIVLFVVNFLLTSATVVIYAKGNQLPVSASFTADPNANATTIGSSTLKAQNLTSNKSLTQQVPATGSLDVGTKASGTIDIKNCYSITPLMLPSGTTFSSGGLNFTSNSAVMVPPATLTNHSPFVCSTPGSANVTVTAAQNGDSYNLGSATYSVGSYPNDSSNGVVGQGSQMSGGVTKTETVVQQSDIDGAVAAMLSGDKAGAQTDLTKQAANGYQMITSTLTQTPSGISSDTPVGAQATNINVKVTAGYSALAIASSDLDKFLSAQALKQAGGADQVYDSGAGSAQLTDAKPGSGAQTISAVTNASVGPKIDTTVIAKQIKGKKYGDALDQLNKLPGVDHATITISPSWSTGLPSRTGRIKISIKVVSPSG